MGSQRRRKENGRKNYGNLEGRRCAGQCRGRKGPSGGRRSENERAGRDSGREAMSTRVHELAKELKLSSKELMDKLKKLKVAAKNHMSVLEPESVKLVKESLKKAP